MGSIASSCAIAALLLFMPCKAFAHAHLRTAAPVAGSTASIAPTEVALSFTERLEPRLSTIKVQDTNGARVDSGSPTLSADAKHFSIGLKPLAPGTYTVTWHATSVDTHTTDGTFEFTVAP